jgi:hypothetical protein
VIDPSRDDFKDSARIVLDRADALVLRGGTNDPPVSEAPWMRLPRQLLNQTPSVHQREGEPLPLPLQVLVRRTLEGPADVKL